MDLEKTINKLSRKILELVMRKEGKAEVLVRTVMSQHEEAETIVRADYELPL